MSGASERERAQQIARTDALLRDVQASINAYFRGVLDEPDAAFASLMRAARAVVWARYKPGGEWEDIKEAIGRLEDLVGRPERDPDEVTGISTEDQRNPFRIDARVAPEAAERAR